MMTANTKSRTLFLAVCQMNSGSDKDRNKAAALALIEEAADRGADIAVLPEMFVYMGPDEGLADAAERVPGPDTAPFQDAARRRNITILCGSVPEKIDGSGKVYNTSLLIGPDGNPAAMYRKIHLMNSNISGGPQMLESDFMEAGTEAVTAELPLPYKRASAPGTGEDAGAASLSGVTAGLSICYDLRFPELFRLYAEGGARLVFLPAAFTRFTGKDHWEVLLRARAVENQMYIAAAGQYGEHPGKVPTYGRSMIVDPWGCVVARAPDRTCVITAELDTAFQDRIRSCLPSLLHRRKDLFNC
jgi:predicted amidohydrolase